MRLVVTCGYAKSLHAVGLIHGLAERGHEVVGCLCVKVLNPWRLRSYLRQLGPLKLWRKVHATMLSRATKSGDVAPEIAAVLALLRERDVASRNVHQACRSVGGRLVRVTRLCTPAALEQLKSLAPDLVVYAGGGILRKPFLEIPRFGVLNAHGGPLPAFRGMNASEWALFHGVRTTVTTHLIDPGIDTGPMLAERPVPSQVWRSGILHGRGVAARVGVEALLDTVDAIARGDTHPVAQAGDAGRQFFVMADPLVEVLDRWIAAGRTPVLDAASFRFPVPTATCAIEC